MLVVTICHVIRKTEGNLNKSNYLHAQEKSKMQLKVRWFLIRLFTLIMTLLRLKHQHDNHCNCLENEVHNHSLILGVNWGTEDITVRQAHTFYVWKSKSI